MARTTQQETDIAPLKSTTLTDPGASAITTAIVDVYSEVIITTTAVSTAQTLPTPTNTTQIKRFTITNNDTSTHTIKINNETIKDFCDRVGQASNYSNVKKWCRKNHTLNRGFFKGYTFGYQTK